MEVSTTGNEETKVVVFFVKAGIEDLSDVLCNRQARILRADVDAHRCLCRGAVYASDLCESS